MSEHQCFYFGCWNAPGNYLHGPSGWRDHRLEYYANAADRVHLDGTLAPRAHQRTGALCWVGQGETNDARRRIEYDSREYPQGQFLRHVLSTGVTAIQWWDRCQGDGRGACNSTILLEGEHTTEEMLTALGEHFPHVLENLKRHGVELVEVHKP